MGRTVGTGVESKEWLTLWLGPCRSEYTRITVLYALRSLQGSFIAWS